MQFYKSSIHISEDENIAVTIILFKYNVKNATWFVKVNIFNV
jgi:hypothetical protein